MRNERQERYLLGYSLQDIATQAEYTQAISTLQKFLFVDVATISTFSDFSNVLKGVPASINLVAASHGKIIKEEDTQWDVILGVEHIHHDVMEYTVLKGIVDGLVFGVTSNSKRINLGSADEVRGMNEYSVDLPNEETILFETAYTLLFPDVVLGAISRTLTTRTISPYLDPDNPEILQTYSKILQRAIGDLLIFVNEKDDEIDKDVWNV